MPGIMTFGRYSILAATLCGVYLCIINMTLSVQFRDFVTSKWRYLYWMFGENDLYMWCFGTYIYLQLLFIIGNAFFMYVDLTGKPNWMKKYKIQKNATIDMKKYMKSLKLSIFNNIVVYFIGIATFLPLVVSYRKVPCGSQQLPTIPQLLVHFLFNAIVEEISFYYIHRALHHPLLYTRINKIHHQWSAPVSISQIYCHPVEHYFLNSLPTALGTLLLGNNYGNHLISFWSWLAIVKGSSAIVHSGYHVPFLTSSEEHDFHHKRFNQNFGTFGLMDYIHGTSNDFLDDVAYKRHFVITGLSSAREIVPDKDE